MASDQPNATSNGASDASENGGSPQLNRPVTADSSPISDCKKCKPNNKNKNWTEIFAFLAAIGGIFAAIFAGVQACVMNQTMVGDQRAWVAPIAARLETDTPEPSSGQIFRFVITFENIGKSPALDLGDNEELSYADSKGFVDFQSSYQPEPSKMPSFGNENPACKQVHPIDGGLTVFPTGKTDEIHRQRTVQTNADIARGAEILFIDGCFAYRSFATTRITAFCYYPNPTVGQPFNTWPLKPCPNGHNYAK